MLQSVLTKSLLTLLFCCFIIFAAGAQVTDRAKNRAEDRANRRVDQKIDEGVDRALDKVEGLFRRNKKDEENDAAATAAEEVETEAAEDSSTNGFLRGLSFGGDFEPYQNPIKMNLQMEIVSNDKRGREETMDVDYTFDTWRTGIHTEMDDGDVRILLDNQEGYMTIISTDKKGERTGMRMRQVVVEIDEIKADPEAYSMQATGNTRTINGYNCSEYIIEHEDGTTTTWLTKDLELDYADFARAMAAQAGQGRAKLSSSQQDFGYEGFPIEWTTVSTNGKETTVMRVKNIEIGDNINLNVFDTNGIEVTNLGF